MEGGLVVGVVAAVLGLLKVAQWFGWLPAGPVAKAAAARADAAEKELRAANLTIQTATVRIAELEGKTSLEPVLEVMTRLLDGQEKVLAKLSELNGGLQHAARSHEETARALAATGEAIKVLATAHEMRGE